MNVLLHAVNTCLVYRLGCRLKFHPQAALAAALLWGVQPLLTSDVAYVSSISEPLVGFFTLIGVNVLLPDFAPRRGWLSCLFLILALGSKESAVVFPALATLTLFLVSDERLRPSTYIRTWPLWLLAGAYAFAWLIPHYSVMHDPADLFYSQFYAHNLANRIFTSLATLPVYAGLMVWPACLYMERDFAVFTSFFSPQVLAGAAMAAGAVLLIIFGKSRPLSWGLLWFAVAFSPVTGIVKPIDAFVSEGWMYLPTIGLFLGLAQTAMVWVERQKSEIIPAALVIAAALSLGAKTYLQNKTWHDHISLFEHALQCGSHSGRAHVFLGIAYFDQQEYQKAAENFRAFFAHPAPVWQGKTSYMHYRLAFIYLGLRPDAKGAVAESDLNKALASASPEAIEELKATIQTAPEGDPDAVWAKQFLTKIESKKEQKGD